MIELGRHLEVLLLSNDCVAVPDFGGFVAHYVPARIDETDNMFLPPMRTIGFNPHLKMNDSLLAQSYVETFDISYPEALLRIEQEIDEIKRQVQYEGVYHLDGVGTLVSNGEGNFSFEPQESGLLTPSLYGLSSYEFSLMNSLPSIQNHAQTATTEEVTDTIEDESEETVEHPLDEIFDDEDDKHAIQIKMSWIRNTVAVVAAVLLFFFITTPVANSDFGSQTMSTLQNNFFSKLMPKDSSAAPAVVVAKKESTIPVVVDKPKAEAKADTLRQIAQPEEKPYCLVLASQVKLSNAEEFVRILHNKGFKDASVYIHNNIVRVVYGHFKSESAAYIELHNLRFEEHFEEAWVYKRQSEG